MTVDRAARYVRIWADAEGDSHFEDVEVTGTLSDSPVSSGRSVYAAPIPAREVIVRRVVDEHPPDRPHPAPRRQFLVHLAGSAEVEVSDGEVRRFGPGDLVLVEDTHGSGHITRNPSGAERITLFIVLPDTST